MPAPLWSRTLAFWNSIFSTRVLFPLITKIPFPLELSFAILSPATKIGTPFYPEI
jgi:hypothetical protein